MFRIGIIHASLPGRRNGGRRVSLEPKGTADDSPHFADLWVPSLAPSSDLSKWFDHDESKWYEFRRRYGLELARSPAECERLRTLACRSRLQLEYRQGDERYNVAVALKQHLEILECQRRWDAGLMIGGHLAPLQEEIQKLGGLFFAHHKAWTMPDEESLRRIRSLLPGDF